MGKRHKWASVVCAWAKGQDTLFRVSTGVGSWSEWRMVPADHRFVDDLTYEYRIADTPAPKKWQREREAYLAGEKVEFLNISVQPIRRAWMTLTEDHFTNGDPWKMEHLEFRLAPDEIKQVGQIYIDALNRPLLKIGRGIVPNIKLTFGEGQLKGVALL
jgi:hypothetical protein